MGPTQGVQAKLKTKPKTKAITGDAVIVSIRNGSLRSLARNPHSPSSPDWYRPNRIMRIPPIRVISFCCLINAPPAAEAPSPSRKNAVLMPSTKSKVLRSTFPRSKRRLPSVVRSAVPPDRYPKYTGSSGSTQGEKKLKSPCRNTATEEISEVKTEFIKNPNSCFRSLQ